MQILKKILLQFRGLGLKTVAYSALPIYWLILLTSTFLHLNWRWHWVTKFAFHPTRLAFTWNILKIHLFLLLAPWIKGLSACTLVIKYLSLLTLAWSLNPWPLVGMLVASSLRACKLVPTLLEFFYFLWCPIIHLVFTITDIGYGPVPACPAISAFIALFRGRARSIAARWCHSRRPWPEFNWSLVYHVWWHPNN